MGSVAEAPSRLRLRLFGLALLVVLPAAAVVAVTSDRDRGTWIAFGVASVIVLIASWVLGSILIDRPESRAFSEKNDASRGRGEFDEEWSAFVSVVSHELRNPMATIRGFGQMLRDQPELLPDAERQRAYEVIVRQVDRMASLVDNVLDASRIGTDAYAYAFIPYSVRELLAEAIEDAASLWPDTPITLDATGAPARARGDRDRMKQVFANLLSNACRYSDPGVEVAVRARADGTNLVVDVIDRGVGIDPEDLPHLFERFARGRAPGVDGLRGAGLGLYICRRIVKAHGGRITVDSVARRGSTFTIRVPLEPPSR